MKQYLKNKMNTLLSVSAIFAVLAMVGVFMQSCESEFDSIEFDDSNILNFTKNEFSTWQQQLDYVISGLGAQRLASQGLILVNYKQVESRPDKEFLKRETINDRTMVPVYNDSVNFNNFELLPIADLISPDLNKKGLYANIKKNIINNFIDSDVYEVELIWNYKGRSFNTNSLVCDTCVIYDDILSNIRYVTIDYDTETVTRTVIPRLKSDSENDNSNSTSSIKYTFTSPTYSSSNFLGMTCASAYCKLEVRGTENNKKVKSLSSYSNMSQYWATPGFSASANVNVSSFVSGSNGHCAFQYAVMTGSSSSLTIGWNGSSYTLPSGGHGQSGGEYIIPSDLN